MAGDHSYTAPKTDGTFGLKVNWKQLSKAIPNHQQQQQQQKLPFQPIQPVTMQELEQKTLGEWWNWRGWRKTSPFQQFNIAGQLSNYRVRHLSGTLPTSASMRHLLFGLIVIGFIGSYPKNSKHLYAENH